MPRTEVDPPATVAAAQASLGRIAEGVRWAYSAGWYPGRRWVGEPAGQEMHLAQDDSDRVPGAVHDIGRGDYRARSAVRRVGPGLSESSAQVADALLVLSAAYRWRQVPKGVALPAACPLDSLLRGVRQVDAQLDLASGASPYGRLNDFAMAHFAGRLTNAADRLARVAHGFDRWTDGIRESRALPVSLCHTCHRRPRPMRNGKLHGRECDTCATYRYRHGGNARPTCLDDDDRQAVIEAKARRTAAGMGYGWS